MTTIAAPVQTPTIPGTPFAGGFYVGRFQIDGQQYALIVSPKTAGTLTGKWGEFGQDVPGARSYNDGRANTLAMAEAGSELAQQALALNINGLDDWYIPSRDELELCYRYLKPTAGENYCSFRDGDNASSLPVGYPYTEDTPAQTPAEAFRDGGAEAFNPRWYWASTQFSPDYAWGQTFDDGYQNVDHKDYQCRARAVRRELVL
ncbi:hypothetical protein NH8B_0950 [Pseudogulbenkiania sp. NH8B]|uniref:Lcl domain-containing protein n=1 Tax=Pseudogulbenkiania sp. (strain NH8B) TaxID=748280 RepID=UPI0002279A74|nr:DUF1566 domain-containing protein [Pseudogulbenkiania sp. NH8B]BAK75782.1 hypothetical protein NH8B_0950 [Pseudogulbenkiania sp. NH8B]